ncbi:MAG: hypothetical protein AUG06_10300 [Actinobacteria bacterium 13_1_20CM_2_65_11]|nr:MAG: hypothetical protein AUI42_09070 [Actinobacteria bacterium 13_1_40CM_2_65_8]OLE78576.1 MAG: hypothetical protein AUG06_10300 [Actinobacteria bacterium 13_1_20CM_2_65_11]
MCVAGSAGRHGRYLDVGRPDPCDLPRPGQGAGVQRNEREQQGAENELALNIDQQSNSQHELDRVKTNRRSGEGDVEWTMRGAGAQVAGPDRSRQEVADPPEPDPRHENVDDREVAVAAKEGCNRDDEDVEEGQGGAAAEDYPPLPGRMIATSARRNR